MSVSTDTNMNHEESVTSVVNMHWDDESESESPPSSPISMTINSTPIINIPSSIEKLQPTIYHVYRIRWWILFLYCLGNCTNSFVWITYAPIATTTSEYYGISKTQVDIITTIYPMCSFAAMIFSTFIYHQYSIRTGLLIGAGLTCVTWVRCLSVINPTSSNGLAWLVIGELFPAFGQPFFTNAPAMIAAQWFAPEQRDIATTIAAMSNPLGIAIGQLIPTAIVSTDGTGMFYLHLIQSIVTTFSFIMMLLFFKSQPPTPPSYATAQQWELRAQDHHTLSQSSQSSFYSIIQLLIRDYKILLKNKHFLILMGAFGIGLGMFNALSTLIEQYITPAGYTADDAGLCGALIILLGFLGSGVFGAILDATHIYKPMLKIVVTCMFGACCFVVFGMQPHQVGVVYASFAMMGFFMVPLLPIVFECTVECTYPIAEESSNGLLMLAGELFGIPMVFILNYTIQLYPTYEKTTTPTNIILLVCFGIAALLLWCYNGPYKRLEAEKLNHQQDLQLQSNTKESSNEKHGSQMILTIDTKIEKLQQIPQASPSTVVC